MTDLNRFKTGIGEIPSALMFNKYKTQTSNDNVFFEELIPKSNIDADSRKPSNKVWQVNTGWEVEIINSKKIAIKKFKIDTWGLRQIVPQPHNGNPNYDNFKLKVTGITRVHNEVICHTAGSNVPDGFTKAYGGNGGYNVYWYPGQFTNGSSLQGLCVQFGCGYTANENERDDSFQIGKHPWDIGTRSCIVDGELTGPWADGSYRAITIGIYGGVQNAKSWHDETGGAYKQYDISDNPIIVDLSVEDLSKEIDVTSVECWDAFVGENHIYHKDKTFENCWKKYGLVFPIGCKITGDNFTRNEYIEWLTPTKFIIKSIPKTGIVINNTQSKVYSNYTELNFKKFDVNVITQLPKDVSIKVVREFNDLYHDIEISKNVYKNPVQNIEIPLKTGKTTIDAYSTGEIYKPTNVEFSTYTECKFVISSKETIYNINCIVEIFPTFEKDFVINHRYGLNKMKIPTIVDLEKYINNITFNVSPTNADFWTPVKNYYKNNVFVDSFYGKFKNCGNLDELSLILPNTNFLYYDTTFKFSSLKKLALTGQKESTITSLNGIFEGLGNLKEFIVNVNPNHWGDFLAGANDCSNMFNGCGLTTYPSNFINWGAYRSNAQNYSKNATVAHSMFWWSSIVTVPNYGTNPDADDNTIICGSASGIFYKCLSLKTVGPILDLQLIKPQSAENIFVECNKLTTIRIKNLNHGDWRFDNTTFSGNKKHGSLALLDLNSIKYLFDNLMDLKLFDATKNIETINNSFSKWNSNYFKDGIFQSNYDFKFKSMNKILLRKRAINKTNAQFIVHTSASNITMKINISGLLDGESIIFGTAGETNQDFTISKNGNYTITKTDNLDKGFRLLGAVENTSDVIISIDKGWDLSIPTVQNANLYCPAEWETKVTQEMITAAKAKNWNVYIGGTLKTV